MDVDEKPEKVKTKVLEINDSDVIDPVVDIDDPAITPEIVEEVIKPSKKKGILR